MAEEPQRAEAPASTRAGEGTLEDVLSRVRASEPAAIDAWYRSEHGNVYRLCFGFLADPAEAEEAAQDAMCHLIDRLASYDPRRPYGPWRDAVVLNLCRDRWRAREARERARRGALERLHDRSATGDAEGALDPLRLAERAEVARVLRETLSSLTPREREVFVLRDLEGRSIEETAVVLEVAAGTVRSMLTLARRRLRTLLGRRFGDALLESEPQGVRRG